MNVFDQLSKYIRFKFFDYHGLMSLCLWLLFISKISYGLTLIIKLTGGWWAGMSLRTGSELRLRNSLSFMSFDASLNFFDLVDRVDDFFEYIELWPDVPTDEMASEVVAVLLVMALLGSSCDASRDEAADEGAPELFNKTVSVPLVLEHWHLTSSYRELTSTLDLQWHLVIDSRRVVMMTWDCITIFETHCRL